MCLPLTLVYYLLPNTIICIQKQLALILLFISVCIFECYRIRWGVHIVGLREHERSTVASYLWAAGGLVLCFLFLPMRFVVPSVVAAAFIDPLIGELRRRNSSLYPYLPIALYALIFGIALTLVSAYQLNLLLSFTATATIVGIAAEYPNIKYLDDDFLMMVLPAALLTFIGLLL